MRKCVRAAVIAASLMAYPAYAQDTPEAPAGPLDVEVSVEAVSDYRFRGVSLSNEKVALQPGITVTHESGIYWSVWGSNIAANGGDDLELDATVGYSREFGNVTAGVGLVGYFYPGASGLNYVDILGSISTKVGPGTIGLNVAYAPKQKHIGSVDNSYAAITAELPIAGTPLTLNGSFGIEDGAFGNAKRDWSLGAALDIKGFTAGVKYIDTARSFGLAGADPTVVFSLSRSF